MRTDGTDGQIHTNDFMTRYDYYLLSVCWLTWSSFDDGEAIQKVLAAGMALRYDAILVPQREQPYIFGLASTIR